MNLNSESHPQAEAWRGARGILLRAHIICKRLFEGLFEGLERVEFSAFVRSPLRLGLKTRSGLIIINTPRLRARTVPFSSTISAMRVSRRPRLPSSRDSTRRG